MSVISCQNYLNNDVNEAETRIGEGILSGLYPIIPTAGWAWLSLYYRERR